jgi:hypothetical protein
LRAPQPVNKVIEYTKQTNPESICDKRYKYDAESWGETVSIVDPIDEAVRLSEPKTQYTICSIFI